MCVILQNILNKHSLNIAIFLMESNCLPSCSSFVKQWHKSGYTWLFRLTNNSLAKKNVKTLISFDIGAILF